MGGVPLVGVRAWSRWGVSLGMVSLGMVSATEGGTQGRENASKLSWEVSLWDWEVGEWASGLGLG